MRMQYYTKFWDIVSDWRLYDSRLKTKIYDRELKIMTLARQEYLAKKLDSLLVCTSPEGRSLLQGYYGILVPEGQEDRFTQPILPPDRMEKLKARVISRLDKIVKRSKIVDVFDNVELYRAPL